MGNEWIFPGHFHSANGNFRANFFGLEGIHYQKIGGKMDRGTWTWTTWFSGKVVIVALDGANGAEIFGFSDDFFREGLLKLHRLSYPFNSSGIFFQNRGQQLKQFGDARVL